MEYGIFFERRRIKTEPVNDSNCPSEGRFTELLSESFRTMRARAGKAEAPIDTEAA
ncbi:hypothetical protein [Qipengyuania sp. MTN3-11]|uniref:hypothetical protein n=1 Tax=Qipengyuania sp. MTN3-11 TaxID=3056557 RepID=UPI0036F40E18